MIEFYVIDTETNGLKTKYHEVNEIGIIRAKDKVQLVKHIKCENPQNSSYDALKIIGKSISDLSFGDIKESVVEQCDKFFNEDGLTPAHRCIVGHNIISFDKRFLHALWESVGKYFPADLYLDTMHMAREYNKILGIKGKVNLKDACETAGIKKFAQQHSAKMDSRNTYLLFKDYVDVKKLNYLPFIKTFKHEIINSVQEYNDDIDMSILEN